MPHFDCIIIGLGAMGSAACYQLARRGRRVLGIDQHDSGHTLGSSHGSSRMIRMCYFEHADYVPLLRRAYELWDDLVRDSGMSPEHIFKRTGGLYMGPAGCEAVDGSRRAAEMHRLDHELLTRAELAERYPQFELGEEFVGLFEPQAGYLVPEAVLDVHRRLAVKSGATMLDGCAVTGWRSTGDHIELQTLDKLLYSADQVIVTTGAWANELLADAGVRVTATRQVLGWVQPKHQQPFASGVLPVWAIDAAHVGEGLYYGFPMLDGPHQRVGLKLARHLPGVAIDVRESSRGYLTFDEQTFRPCLRRWIPKADGPLQSAAVCVYENSPDQHFIIDRHPRWPNVFMACGFSGHGFKFASVVGEILADLAIDGMTRHPIGFLSLQRFARARGKGDGRGSMTSRQLNR